MSSVDAEACVAIPGWFPPLHGLSAIEDRYGRVELHSRLTWPAEGKWMHTVKDLPGVGRPLYINRELEPMLRAALQACLELSDGYTIASIASFNVRMKRSNGGEPSVHSWGLAIDINPDTNPPLRIASSADLARRKKSIPDAWVEEWERIGWTWGGRFTGYYDPMHFQWVTGY